MIDKARNHLNTTTDWYRAFTPGEYPEIKQVEKIKDKSNQWSTIGNESILVAKTLGTNPSNGVGGQNYFAFYEEAGIAQKLDQTLAFFEPAVLSGDIRVGSFCAAGSVGDLKDSKPLEKFIKNPDDYGFLSVPTKWYDLSGAIKQCGLFIPSQYGRPECVDEYGNSDVECGIKKLDELYEKWSSLPPEEMTLKMSQEPRTIQEAFATRTPNKFNPQKIKRRIDQIEIKLKNKEMTPKKGLLDINKDGDIYLKPLSAFTDYERPVEIGYPVDPKIIDKRGVVTIWEEPDKDNKGIYFAGVDTIESEVTKTSESLLSVHIYKRSVKEIVHSNGESNITYKSGKIVASYRGRFNSSQETNEMGMMLIRLYNAFAAVERNKPNFINDARRAGFTSYIARENELPFNKDVPMTDSNTPYGVYMDSANNLRQKLEDNLLDYLNRETSRDNIYDNDGNVIKTVKI
jgi:hypothetical protein